MTRQGTPQRAPIKKGGRTITPEPIEKTKKNETWKGIPRENIEWHPFIDEKRCTGCGMCVTSCGRKVFDKVLAFAQQQLQAMLKEKEKEQGQ